MTLFRVKLCAKKVAAIEPRIKILPVVAAQHDICGIVSPDIIRMHEIKPWLGGQR